MTKQQNMSEETAKKLMQKLKKLSTKDMKEQEKF